jgi:peptidoglycan hydrolase CwlO-like protein
MTPDSKQSYCHQHFEFAKHWGVMERALSDIDKKINKLFEMMDENREKVNCAKKESHGMKEALKTYGFTIAQLLALISIAIKLWGG